ncbi:MAG: hypothetical protein CMB80_06290 [Flammeovirgaceae bacterium]|nr:hypothetical protein [Flammeovirgaceae bacterium]MBE62848.1 hypothetical protein [Flammeovirgaceae bacterium]HCX21640.1 hypothetical protein [Cytophagales bacterium]|tara:strand:- start:569 stop:1153 length:585 start_codon:yes stop_codon:yes gene_type:complete
MPIKTVDEFFSKVKHYQKELSILRALMDKTELVESIKWGMPVYTINGKNVVGLGAHKSYFGLWFYSGSLLSDPNNVLINAQEGKTKGMRQLRFQSEEEIDAEVVMPLLLEAIENQKLGKEIKPQKKKLEIPDELKEALSNSSQLSEAFDSLTPGKQKEYTEYISEAKRIETRLKRLEKITPMILSGVGLNDRYK